MKIVFVGPFGSQPKSTMRRRALPLARALVRRGHQVSLLLPPWDDPARSGQSWEDGGVMVTNVSLPPACPLLFQGVLTTRLIRQVLKQQPEVIHFFKPKAYAGLAHWGLWTLRRLGRISARLVLDSDDWEQAWNERLPYSVALKKLFAWQEKWGLGRADAVTVASRHLVELVMGQRPARDLSHIFYVPNGRQSSILCDLSQSQRSSASLRAEAVREQWQLGPAPVVLLYSRFAEFRLSRVVELIRAVAKELPRVRWLIVGQGLLGEERVLAEELAAARLSQYVRFTGWLPVEALPAYFAAANVAIYPYDDNLLNRTKCSIKLIDLLLAGLPVVADAVGQNCEYVQDGKSGVLVPPEDDLAFGRAMIELLRLPEQQQRLGQAAQHHIRQELDWGRLAQTVEQAYLS